MWLYCAGHSRKATISRQTSYNEGWSGAVVICSNCRHKKNPDRQVSTGQEHETDVTFRMNCRVDSPPWYIFQARWALADLTGKVDTRRYMQWEGGLNSEAAIFC